MATNPVFPGVLLSLYRRVLRVHRLKLPPPMRLLGHKYVRAEFDRHLQADTTPVQWQTFLIEWQRYVHMLEGKGTSHDDASGTLAPDILDSLTPEQQQQLAQLRQETLKLHKELVPDDGH